MNGAEIEVQLIEAISRRSELMIDYKGEGERTVQPHVLYRHNDGKLFVEGKQIAGYSSSGEAVGWRQFEVAEIAAAVTLASSFEPAGGYNLASPRYKSGLIRGVA